MRGNFLFEMKIFIYWDLSVSSEKNQSKKVKFYFSVSLYLRKCKRQMEDVKITKIK